MSTGSSMNVSVMRTRARPIETGPAGWGECSKDSMCVTVPLEFPMSVSVT